MLAFAEPTMKRSTTPAPRQPVASLEVARHTEVKDARLEARLPAPVMARIKQAASIEERSLTDFVVAHLNSAAQNVLLDQTFFSLDKEKFNAFEAMMAAPMSENKAIQQLLNSTSPWDK